MSDPRRDPTEDRHGRRHRSTPLLTLLLGLIAALSAGWWQSWHNAELVEQRFSGLVERAAARIDTRMQIYEYGLRGARGAVIAAGVDDVTREAFRRYAETRDVTREFPGVRGFGFIRRVEVADEAAFVAAARRDEAPRFAITQLAAHDGERYVIQYIEPVSANATAVGLDIASEVNRRSAAEASMRTGAATLTAPITLVQAREQPQQSFLLLLPVLRSGAPADTPAQREAATVGWSYAPLVATDVLAAVSEASADYVLSLRDVTEDPDPAPFFAVGDPGASLVQDVVQDVEIQVYGRVWRAEFRATPAFLSGLDLTDPRTTTFNGFLLAFLVATLAYFYTEAASRTQKLGAERAYQATIVEASSDAVISATHDGTILSWNPAAERIFGYDRGEIVGQPLTSLLPPEVNGAHASFVQTVIRKGRLDPIDARGLRRDGTRVDVSISAYPLLDEARRVIGIGASVRDISAQKAVERQLRSIAAELEAKVAERTANLDVARRDLQTTLDAMPSMIGYWDAQLRNRFANVAYRECLPGRPADITGQSMRDVLDPQMFDQNWPAAQAALRGESQSFERTVDHPESGCSVQLLARYIPDIQDSEVRGFYVLAHDVTELNASRRRADSAQRDTEFLLQTIQDHAIVSVADRRGRITEVNDAFCRITGYDRGELIGHDHRIVNSGEQGPGFWVDVWRTIGRGQSWRGEVCNRAKDGSLYWVDSIIAPRVGDDGRVDSYLSLRFDITDRKRAEQALRETSERFAMAADAAGIGVWVYDLRSDRLRWDDWMYRLYGRESSDATEPYTLWSQALHPQDRARAETEIARCKEGLAKFETEFRIVFPSGEVREISAAAKLEHDESGNGVRMIGVNIDITERKRAEARLSETSALLRSVLESASRFAIIAVGPDKRITIFNRGAERLLGYRSEEVVGRSPLELIHDGDEVRSRAQELSAQLQAPIADNEVFTTTSTLGQSREWTYIRKDGTRMPVSLVVTAMYGESGALLGYLGIAQDVGPQKEHERRLHAAIEHAEAANRSKSQFLANMSHEIRSPMNAVIGLTYLLGRTRLDAEQAGYLDKVRIASKSLLGVINDILDISKIEAGELRVGCEAFRLDDLLTELGEIIRVQVDQKQIGFELDLPSDIPMVLDGDALRLNQILSNLLSNAVKFTLTGGVRLSVRVREIASQRVKLRFEVVDTGIGISPESAEHLFQPFSQADGSITRRFGGTGLGLSIVKHLVEMMDGEIGLQSEAGIGSTFWVELSLACSSGPAARTPQRVQDAAPGLVGVRVLVVDDSQINLEVARRILCLEGATVTTAGNGLEAVVCLRAQPAGFDLILMDIHMPVLDGLSATRSIRNELGLQRIPILALTAGALPEQRTEAQEAGMNDFLTKPFEPADVVAAIRRHVGGDERAGKEFDAPQAAAQLAAPSSPWRREIPGIALAEVELRLGGDEALLRSLLMHLLQEFDPLPALGTSDDALKVLSTVMHKLRGAAGNVGALAIGGLAAECERACAVGNRALAERLHSRVDALLLDLRYHVSAWLDERDNDHDHHHHAPVQMHSPAALERLVQLLRDQQVAAIDAFQALSPTLRTQLGAARYLEVRGHVENLRFCEAAHELSVDRGQPMRDAS